MLTTQIRAMGSVAAGLALSITTHSVAGPPVDSFTINLEEMIMDGVPGAGAGNIEVAGASDEYTFTVAPGTEVFFDAMGGSCGMTWFCEDSLGNTIFNDNCIALGDPGNHVLSLGGDYTVTVVGEGATTGTYAFTLWETNPTDTFAIGIKELVADGVPGVGAGNIEEPGTRDEYTFVAAPGDLIFFDEMGGNCGISWSCEDANGDEVFSDSCNSLGDPGTHELTLGGTYTITVDGEADATGTYSFFLWEVNPTDSFTIGLKQPVSDGVPGLGAGNIEEAGTVDEYTFNVAPGTVVFFDATSGSCSISWTCEDSGGTEIFNDTCIGLGDPGTHQLTLGGDYTITVFGEGDATGTYSFTIWEVNPTDSFAIGIKQVVSDGAPGVGAGNIEEAGTLDEYTFTAAPGTVVFFDALSGTCNIAWNCEDSGGTEIFNDTCISLGDPGTHVLDLGGTYTVNVFGEGDAVGTYSFVIWEVNPTDIFTIAYGDEVGDGVPGVGAGNIEEAGTMDEYTFTADPGDDVCFREISGNCGIAWRCVDSNGDQVFSDTCLSIGDPGSFILSLGGDYTIEVFGEGDTTGTYAFMVNLNRASDFNQDCTVNVTDLLELLAGWGTPDGDVNGDGFTNVVDLLELLGDWG